MNKKRLTFLALATATAATASAIGLYLHLSAGSSSAPAVMPVGHVGTDAVAAAIDTDQSALRATPGDAALWASLGSAYVEQGRATADPGYYPKADGSLHKSLTLQPDGNLPAMAGMGMLANARHDFAQARQWADRALAFAPDNATALAVLVDADTQLGDYPAATAAAQRLLDLKPGVAAFTRASYDAEEHGNDHLAAEALRRALADSVTPADVAFCRYYLGELAFNTGDAKGALDLYRQAAHDDPTYTPALAGTAKAEAALGDIATALRDYHDATTRLPLPQYVLEYGELLQSMGRSDEAATEYKLLHAEQQLFAANGVVDDLTAAQADADHGDPIEAVAHARAEWNRRHSVLVADALAWALHRAGGDTEALGYARQAAATGWHNATFDFHRGVIEGSLGLRGQARADLTQALSTNPYFSPLQAPAARTALAGLGTAS